jgi:hypothetical protein
MSQVKDLTFGIEKLPRSAIRHIAAIQPETPKRQLRPMSRRSVDKVERRVPDQLPVVRVTRFFCSAMPDWPGPVY